MLQRLNVVLSYISLSVLAAIGALFIFAVIPMTSSGLALDYEEFSSDSVTLRFLLTVPALIAELVLVAVGVLLWSVYKDRMFSSRAFKWVRFLVATFVALGCAIAAIGVWLAAKNTLPPAILLTLSVFAVLSIAVAFVTGSLLGLLEKATSAVEELEAVI